MRWLAVTLPEAGLLQGEVLVLTHRFQYPLIVELFAFVRHSFAAVRE